MRTSKLFFPLLVFVLVSSTSSAIVDRHSYDFQIEDGQVLVTQTIIFENRTTGSVILPPDARESIAFVDGQAKKIISRAEYKDAKEVVISYYTGSLLERDSFLSSIRINAPTDILEVTLDLGENTVLRRPIEEGSGATASSVYPFPTSITSDGKTITLKWVREELQPDDELSILVLYSKDKQFNLYLLIIPITLVLAGTIYILLRGKKHPAAIEPKQAQEQAKNTFDDILAHLKEDEQQVVRILIDRGGTCDQGTLRFIGDFSKAKLSRLLSELEDRKIIYKEKKGKKNVIRLKWDI